MKTIWRAYGIRIARLFTAVSLVVVSVLVMFPAPASAHPLGNFTVNRYARIEPAGSVVRIVYVLDQAEIPTFQDQPDIDADQNAFVDKRVAEIERGLALTIDGRPSALTVANKVMTQPPGQGGLPTLRIAALLETPAPAAGSPHSFSLADSNEPDRVGWREMVATPTGDSTISGASVPETDATRELRQYPANLLQAPLDVRRMNMDFDPGSITPAAPSLVSNETTTTKARTTDRFGDLIGSTALSAGGIAVAGLLALLFGAVHALGPGHGKSVMAAYLVGTKGRPRDAIWLGVIVAIMHTGSVLVLGFGLLLFDSTTDLARLYPALNIASGVVILSFGATLAWRRMHAAKSVTSHTHDDDAIDIRADDHDHSHGEDDDHSHDHDDHDHGHSHGHDHPHPHNHEHAAEHEHGAVKTVTATAADTVVMEHSHGGFKHSHALPTGVAPLSRRGLLVLAGSGGLLPSPSAVIVILSAASLHRIPLGLALVGIFSIGLAAVLSAVGLSLVYGREYFSRRPGAQRAFRFLPVLSAAALIVLGTILAVRGIISL